MRFATCQDSLNAAAAANIELCPCITWLGKVMPVRLVGAKMLRGRKDPWGIHPELWASACAVPPGMEISILTTMTQLGLDAANHIREMYSKVTTRPRNTEGATELPEGSGPKLKGKKLSKNGSAKKH